jgi:hypothetical protein
MKSEYLKQQRATRNDEITLCVVALLCVVLCMGVLINAAIESEQRAAQRASDARLARTGSRLCLQDGRTIDQMRFDEPVRAMSARWCKR